MFDDEILEKIFTHPEIHKIPIVYQSEMINIIEDVLRELGVNVNATVSES